MPDSDALNSFEAAAEATDGTDAAVAIVGAACRMPGAPDIGSFWRLLFEGREALRPFTAEERAEAGLDPATAKRPDHVAVGAVLETACDFDPEFFGMSEAEALETDPQHRLFLACAAEALQVAGLGGRPRLPIGVFGCARMSTWVRPDRAMLLRLASPRVFQALTGNDKDYIATRTAYRLDLSGPAMAVQSACSSSLVAVHMAAEQLRAGACDLALAGGVGVTFPQALGYLHREGMIFSPDGRCRPFSADAAGTGIGHGCAVVLMKRLDEALADGDEVWAVLRGSAVNNDGAAKAGFTAPSIEGQAAVIAEALAMAGVDPAGIGLVEAHGTGTPLGDPIEVAALTRVWRRHTAARQVCALGSVKANLGHLDTAAGIASLLKAVLALRHRALPPALHAEQPNPALGLEESPFFLPAYALPWDAPEQGAGRRRAAVSSFGIGGTNCHVVLEEAPPAPCGEAAPIVGPVAFAVPARSPAGLARHAARLREALDGPGAEARLLAGSLAHAGLPREEAMLRAYALAAGPAGAGAALDALAGGALPAILARGRGAAIRLTGAEPGAAAAWLRAAFAGRDPFGLAAIPLPPRLARWRDGAEPALPPSGPPLALAGLARWLAGLPGVTLEGRDLGEASLMLAARPPEEARAWLAALDQGPQSPGEGAAPDAAAPGRPDWPARPGLSLHLAESSPETFEAGLRLALWQMGVLAEAPLPRPARRISLPPIPFEGRRLWRPVPEPAAPADAAWQAMLAAGVEALAAVPVDAARAVREREAVTALHRFHLVRALHDLGCFADDAPRDLDALLREGRIDPRFRQLLGRLIEDLAEGGGVRREGAGRYAVLGLSGAPPAADGLVSPGLGRLIARTAPRLAEVLRGEVPLVSLVFPDGDSGDAAALYKHEHYSPHLNAILARLAGAAAAAAGRPVSVLELGAGTGGTTDAVLAALGDACGRYVFTDVGPLFLARARERFAGVRGMEFRPFDIARDPAAQGFAAESFDIVVAANVLHNAPSLAGAMARIAPLLRPGGVLLLREIAERKPLFDLVFGALAPEVEDHEARGGLFAPPAAWCGAARAAGLEQAAAFPEEDETAAAMGEAVIIARRLPPAAAAPAAGPAPLWQGEARAGAGSLALLAEAAVAAGLLPGTLAAIATGARPAPGTPLRLLREDGALVLMTSGPDARPVARARCETGTIGDPPAILARRAAPATEGAEALATLVAGLAAPPGRLCIAALPGRARVGLAEAAGGGLALVAEGTDFPVAWLEPAAARPCLAGISVEPAMLAAERWEALPAAAAPIPAALWLIGREGAPMTEALRAAATAAGIPCEVALAEAAAPIGARRLLLAEDLLGPSGTVPSARLAPLQAGLASLARALHDRPEAAGAAIVTRGALALPGEALREPLLAMAHGMGLSLARETPSVPVEVLDADDHAASLGRIVAGFALPTGMLGALRRGQPLVRRFAAVPPAIAAAWTLPAEGSVVLTGGLSRLGRVVTDWLARQGAGDITLFLHRAPRADEAAALDALRAAHGVTLRLIEGVDCADAAAVEAGFRRLAEAGVMPAAVFHLAGLVRDGLVARQDYAELREAIAVKLDAATAILAAMRGRPGAPVVFFSSLAAVLGPPGEGAHAGANAALEALARAARAEGIAATAIAWDHWREALRPDHQALAARFRTAGMSNEAGLAALGAAMARSRASLVAADPAALALLNGEAPDASAAAAADTAAGDVLGWLRAAVARLVGRPPEEVNCDAGLIQLGIDSLMFLDLGERARRELGVTLDAEAALSAATLGELAALLESRRQVA